MQDVQPVLIYLVVLLLIVLAVLFVVIGVIFFLYYRKSDKLNKQLTSVIEQLKRYLNHEE